MSRARDDDQFGLRSAKAVSTPSPDGKRAASVSRAGTPDSSIRTVGSSSRDGQLRHVEIVHAGGVAAWDLGLLIVRHAGRI